MWLFQVQNVSYKNTIRIRKYNNTLFSVLHDVNELFLSFSSLMKGSPYVFYSRGKITIKGLGQRQTYFVEPPSSTVNSHLELVRNDSDSSSSIPIVNVDRETSPNLTLSRKEEVL